MESGADYGEVDWEVKEVEVYEREVLSGVQDDGATWGEVGVAHVEMVGHFGGGCDELQNLDAHEQAVDGMSEIWTGVRPDVRSVLHVVEDEVDGPRDHVRDRGFEIWVGALV